MDSQKVMEINDIKKKVLKFGDIMGSIDIELRTVSQKLEAIKKKIMRLEVNIEDKDFEIYKEYFFKESQLHEKRNEHVNILKQLMKEHNEIIINSLKNFECLSVPLNCEIVKLNK